MMDLPLISCLCVSRNRPEFLKRSIDYFINQSYPRRELIIVFEGLTYPWNESFLHSNNITIVPISPGSPLTLGERRNLAVERCNGSYFCTWDDDDFFHKQRLEIQINNLLASGKPAIVLDRLLLFDRLENRAYLSSKRLWEGSLLCETKLVTASMKYTPREKSEDNDFVVRLGHRDLICTLTAPHVYAYVFHGANTWNQNHFTQLFRAGYALGATATRLLKRIMENQINYADASRKLEALTRPSDIIKNSR